MKTLKLFNCVIDDITKSANDFGSDDLYFPYVANATLVDRNAMWAISQIFDYYNNLKLSGNDLNKSFYKSFETVLNSSRFDLYMDQILHYISTYGTDFEGEVYIPVGNAEAPKLELKFTVVKAVSREEMIEMCLDMLRSGIALKEETIDDLLEILEDICYMFTGKEGIRNKESLIKIADMHGVLPDDNVEVLRYCVYKATGDTLLIKSEDSIKKIKVSAFNPEEVFVNHGVEKLAQIFNRFKPIFLAFKKRCPSTINKIAKLSKGFHIPMKANPLNEVTCRKLGMADVSYLSTNATPYALFRAMNAMSSRLYGQSSFCYRIRNGKSWSKEGSKANCDILIHNIDAVQKIVKRRFNLEGVSVYMPDDVEYTLPTSEKMFVGNIPTGTTFYGDQLAIGVYWENSWGAYDIDLSAVSLEGKKIGWNAAYYNKDGITYSGDMTDARNGAIEYLHFQGAVSHPYLVCSNVYRGNDSGVKYKIVIGKGSDVSKPYMMDPNNVMAEVKTATVQKQMVLGIVAPPSVVGGPQGFTVLNFGSGGTRVSGPAMVRTRAIYEQYALCDTSLRTVLTYLGADLSRSREESTHDLSIDSLSKNSFMKIFA